MKIQYQIFTALLILVLALTSCEPLEYGELGEPFSKIGGIAGTWKVIEVIQVDETALAQGGLYTEQDLTGLFNFSDYTITFNVDAGSQPSSFDVVTGGSPSFIDTSGTWTFDNNDFPTEVWLKHPDSTKYSSMMRLIAPPRDQSQLRMKFQRFAGGKLIISYRYTFEKQIQ